jgi:hypothetical protein
MRKAPGFSDFFEIWRAAARARTESIKAEVASLRADRSAAWQRRRELLDARHREALRATRGTELRLARLEAMTEALAASAQVEIPPTVEATADAAGTAEGAPLSTAEKLALVASATGRFVTRTCWPMLAGGARRTGSAAAALGGRFRAGLKRKPRPRATKAKGEAESQPEAASPAPGAQAAPHAAEEARQEPPASEPPPAAEEVPATSGAEEEVGQAVDGPQVAEAKPEAEEEAQAAEAEPEAVPEAVSEAVSEAGEAGEEGAAPVSAGEAEEILEPLEVDGDEPVEVIDASDPEVAAEVPDDSKDETHLVQPVR